MRVLNILLSLLIYAGVSTCSMYEEETISPLERLQSFIRQKCERNGGPMAYDFVAASFDHFLKCGESVSRRFPPAGYRHRVRSSGPLATFEMHCRHIPEIEHCLTEILDSIKVCLDPAELETANILHKMENSYVEFLCRNNAEMLREMTESDGGRCLTSKGGAVTNCFMRIFSSYVLDGRSGGLERLERPLVMERQDCIDGMNVKSCILEELNQCETQKVAKIFESLIDSVMKQTPCEKLVNRETSPDTGNGNSIIVGEDIVSLSRRQYSFFQQKCNKNGGEFSYVLALDSLQFFSDSLTPFMKVPRFETDQTCDRSFNERVLQATSKTYCQRAPIFEKLQKYVTDSIRSCLDQEERKYVDMIDKITSSLVEFVCDDGGEHLTAYIRYGGLDCWMYKQQYIQKCAEQSFGGTTLNVIVGPLGVGRLQTPLELGIKDCINLDNFQDCSVKVLAQCEDKRPSYLLNAMFNSVKKVTPCNSLLGERTPSSTERIPSLLEQQQLVPDIGFLSEIIPDASGVTEENAKNYLRESCIRNGGPTAYEVAKQIPQNISYGIQLARVSLAQLDADMNYARQYGRLDTALKKYCYKVPAVKTYIKRIADSIKPCLEPELRYSVDSIFNTIDSTLLFMCHNEGDRLTMFIAGNGLECLALKHQAVQYCILEYFQNNLPGTGPFVPDVKACTDLKKAQHCVVRAMEECEDPTPATVMNSLINFVSKVTPCNDVIGTQV